MRLREHVCCVGGGVAHPLGRLGVLCGEHIVTLDAAVIGISNVASSSSCGTIGPRRWPTRHGFLSLSLSGMLSVIVAVAVAMAAVVVVTVVCGSSSGGVVLQCRSIATCMTCSVCVHGCMSSPLGRGPAGSTL